MALYNLLIEWLLLSSVGMLLCVCVRVGVCVRVCVCVCVFSVALALEELNKRLRSLTSRVTYAICLQRKIPFNLQGHRQDGSPIRTMVVLSVPLYV